jgi:uncharacterized protein YijF (DUF1287 family)
MKHSSEIIVLLAVVAFRLMTPNLSYGGEGFGQALSQAALERTTHSVRYDGSYRSISYPMEMFRAIRGSARML